MKKYLILFFVIFVFETKAQTINGVPYASIEQRLLADTAMYQQLAGRFLNHELLTDDEMNLLYFGSPLRAGYNPYLEVRILEAGNALARRGKTDDALRLYDNLISKHPACLLAWLEKSALMWQLGDTLQSDAVYDQFVKLLQVPVRSGSGDSPQTAFVVRSEQDEELVLIQLGYEIEKQEMVERNGQNFHLVSCTEEADSSKHRTFYFNIELPLKRGMEDALQKNRRN